MCICGAHSPFCPHCAREVFEAYEFPVEDILDAEDDVPGILEEVELTAWWALGVGYSIAEMAEGEVILPPRTPAVVRTLISEAPESWAVMAQDLSDGTLPAPWLERR